ncbi:hypothetical protein LEP1GSC203_1877 [Leptospira terpstrae serovar Hualin str. LT 11-33 = ATCC 700639]|uniref:Uncharacterized protein n=1 Tax=Leptospira terpstrae serovar Hualin str. LT 11-33 = ATCC 700639 TaxID=1257025 RepID=N1VXA2_9LEPT|nr:hypothetical protein LEP1GSC203_1877 [Leptospira terpstrae serovar Hualin str. LT 11-33 = ATCC 700639]
MHKIALFKPPPFRNTIYKRGDLVNGIESFSKRNWKFFEISIMYVFFVAVAEDS